MEHHLLNKEECLRRFHTILILNEVLRSWTFRSLKLPLLVRRVVSFQAIMRILLLSFSLKNGSERVNFFQNAFRDSNFSKPISQQTINRISY